MLLPLPLHLSACNDKGNGKGGKSDGGGNKEGDGDSGKSNGDGNKEGVGAKPMSVKIHSQDCKLIPVLYNTTEKKKSAGVTLYFHVIPCQPSILLA
jgi:hypothetical protein